jgi:predicted dehydrogenase
MKEKAHQDSEDAVTLAIVGCGAITETFYMPAFSDHPDILEHLVLVDTDLGRAKTIAERFHVGRVVPDYKEVVSLVDGAIIATPHHLHYGIAKDFLEKGVHVLCEKPLTETVAEARELVQLSDSNKGTLSVNLTRRLMPSSEKVKELLSPLADVRPWLQSFLIIRVCPSMSG